MKNVRLAALLLLSVARAAASEPAVQNPWIRAAFDTQTGRLSLSERATGKVFASADAFAPADTTLTVTPFERHSFTFDALVFTRADGSRVRVMLAPDAPFVFFQQAVRNGDTHAVTNRVAYPPLAVDLGLAPDALTALGTGGLAKPADNPGSYMWTALADPATRRGVVAGWVTTERGSGIVRMDVADGSVRLLPHVDYGRLALAPGETIDLETFAVGLFDDARLGLEAYADAVARVYNIRLPPMPTVHCTWYVDGASRESVMTGRTAYAASVLKPFGMDVMQIDDGWQLGSSSNGPKKVFIGHNPTGPYPSGMKPIADTIRAAGMTPGIWLIPFAGSSDDPWFADKTHWFAKKPDGKPYDTRWGGTCFDLTRDDTRAYLKDVIRTLTRDWGYTYLKMDGLYTGASLNLNYVCDTFREDEIGQAVLSDPSVTQIQMMRESLRLVRQTAGPDVFLLGCCTPQNMRSAGAAYGLVHAMRIGPDNGANWSAMLRGPEYGAWNYFLHRRVWYNDPDPLYVRASLPLEHAQALCSWVTLSGQMNSSSENYAALPPDRLDLLKRTMPSHSAAARPVDLFENRIPALWHVTDPATSARPQMDILGLFNWDSAEKTIDLPLAHAGLPADAELIAFDFWANALTPPFKGRLSHTLRPQSCAVLALRPVLDRPQVISTSRHITQGVIDLTQERWDTATRTLSGLSQTVANDRYELRILTHASGGTQGSARGFSLASVAITGPNGYDLTLAPGEGLVTRPDDAYANANTPGAPFTTLFEPQTEEGLLRVAFTCGSGGPVAWRVTFSVPAIPQLGDVPPKPAVPLDTLTPLKTAVGWGAFKRGTALNGPLRLGGETFASGVCIHADGHAVYARDPSWTRFVAVVGIDESQRPQNQSSVIFSVAIDAADGRRVLATSPVIRFGQRERWHFDTALPADAERVVLLAESAGDGNKSDHANWCDAGFLLAP